MEELYHPSNAGWRGGAGPCAQTVPKKMICEVEGKHETEGTTELGLGPHSSTYCEISQLSARLSQFEGITSLSNIIVTASKSSRQRQFPESDMSSLRQKPNYVVGSGPSSVTTSRTRLLCETFALLEYAVCRVIHAPTCTITSSYVP
jgi:hypothetical protein